MRVPTAGKVPPIQRVTLETKARKRPKSGGWHPPAPWLPQLLRLARLDLGQVLVDREPGAEPAERGREGEEARAVLDAEVRQLDGRGVEPGQVGEPAVQEIDADPYDAPGGEPARQSLQGAEIEEGAPDEGVGRA